jgi:biotin carboxylase
MGKMPSTATAQHCCASRITAENPDEGFKPTSGKINSIRLAGRTIAGVDFDDLWMKRSVYSI